MPTRPPGRAVGLPTTYPQDEHGELVGHQVCQPIGAEVHSHGLRGVRCRSARVPDGAGRELAWFPATSRTRPRLKAMSRFEAWYYG